MVGTSMSRARVCGLNRYSPAGFARGCAERLRGALNVHASDSLVGSCRWSALTQGSSLAAYRPHLDSGASASGRGILTRPLPAVTLGSGSGVSCGSAH